ncbi:phosphomannomutase/phosphoglucomutase [Thiorhodovibrio frisius]|uniref:phosphomannomutase n=1 Tax=Thiorhodovibrio frisius TaxID=631362 RepID=H8Z7P1_9GAMM|nr:phosphomannomutase/phosphoglucomutase [Thiorhodovibrio frisius]EIC19894.1 phosphomannomutase [Thiorhodovibrio frisius]WPL20622.1 Phosphomannomutase/phosphoglucomutase [Thiorhodovibrio frisius]
MALGKKSAKHRNNSAQPKPAQPQRLMHYWLGAAAASVVVIGAAFAGTAWLEVSVERQAQQNHLQELVTSLADTLGERKEGLREQLTQLATDRELRTTFEYADQADFGATATRLKQRVPQALALHLIQLESGPSGARILHEDRLSLSYAGLDLIRKVATSGDISSLEAHQVDTPDAHLAIAGPVLANDGRTLLGAIYLALPLELLPEPHANIARNRHFLFQQGEGRSKATIAPKAAPPPVSGAVTASAKIPETEIELLAWQPAPTLSNTAMRWQNLVVAGALVAVNLVIFLTVGGTQARRVKKDIDQLNAGLGQVNLGQPPTKRNIRLQELLGLDDTLKHMSRKRAHTARSSAGINTTEDAPSMRLTDSSGEANAATMDASLTIPSSVIAPRSDGASTSVPPGDSITRVDVAKVLGTIPARVFRPYDIRGLIDSELTADFMRLLGQAVGTESQKIGSKAVLVGHDHRASGTPLTAALTEGLRASGCDVIDLGTVPTPVLYFATHLAGDISGAIVTASHNPAQYNGVKLAFSGKSATALNVAKLKQRLQRGEFMTGEGSYREQSVLADYFDEVEQNISFARPLKVALDCGFATPALVAPQLFRNLGCEVIEVRCDLSDPRAGTELPNPSAPENLRDLIDAVIEHGADIGFGFDGDGDRLGVVDSAGQLIQTDRVLMLLAADLLSRAPGSNIVFDVKCSRLLTQQIKSLGGEPVMWKSGHAFIKEKREELNAPLAGEYSGHIVFGDRWNGFDDAFYAAARLVEVLAIDPRPSQDIFAELPSAIGTPELLARVAPGQEIEIMSQVMDAKGRLSGVKAITIDGLRLESDKGWALIRASNSEAALAFRFEAMNESTLEKLKDLVRRIMQSAAPDLELPF